MKRIFLLIATNGVFARWTRRVEAASGDHLGEARGSLEAIVHERMAALSLTGMILITLAIVFVMVVKPDILRS